jgi:hypothetical protein
LSIGADRQWGILHRPIDLAMRDTLTNQNNETDDGNELAKVGLIPHWRPPTIALHVSGVS